VPKSQAEKIKTLSVKGKCLKKEVPASCMRGENPHLGEKRAKDGERADITNA